MAVLSTKKKRWLQKLSSSRGLVSEIHSFADNKLYSEKSFREKLMEERRRAERSSKPIVLMLISLEMLNNINLQTALLETLGKSLQALLRATDICGILKNNTVIGVILLEISQEKIEIAKKSIRKKTRESLSETISLEMVNKIIIDFSVYSGVGSDEGSFDLNFFPEITEPNLKKTIQETLKRTFDISGSLLGLVLSAPIFVIVSIAVKISSKGPIFFCQKRIGLNGKMFNLIKFRSMYLDNDDIIHRQYVSKLIRGEVAGEGSSKIVYKLQADPRITPIGRFLRKYSVDELPQLLNVLKGDMSLVGPRPPIIYEVDQYCSWQRGRLMGKKPGITGLWQVMGRSTTTFDEMVRLDLRYLKRCTVFTDLDILLRTPLAVVRCKGAY